MNAENRFMSHGKISYLGLLAQTAGMFAESANHFEEGYAFYRKAGFRSNYAWTCYHYASFLMERNGAEDRIKASDLLAEGLSLTQEMGMKLLEGRISARIKELEESSEG